LFLLLLVLLVLLEPGTQLNNVVVEFRFLGKIIITKK
jgi:hypothetical protein